MAVVTRRPLLAPSVPWRTLGVLAMILILIAAALAAYIGSQARLPAPFGPARNGLIAYEIGGDIFTADPLTGAATAVLTGPETDVAPRFSHDGAHIVFERKLEDGTGQLYVARPDFTELTLITKEPVSLSAAESSTSYDFSPDGRSILFMSSKNGLATLSIARTDGSEVHDLDVGMAADRGSFRPPDGAEILFVGSTPSGLYGVYAVDPISEVVRPIVEPTPGRDLTGAAWSPDGSKVLYWSWDSVTASGMSARTHVIGSDGTGDIELPAPPDAVWNAVAAWSNDGTRIFIVRGYTPESDDVRPVVLPADGSSVGVEITFAGSAERECCSAWTWSPDDSKILGRPGGIDGDPRQMILDPVAGDSRPAPWASSSDPAWQRLAR